jgi:hypothetical protein
MEHRIGLGVKHANAIKSFTCTPTTPKSALEITTNTIDTSRSGVNMDAPFPKRFTVCSEFINPNASWVYTVLANIKF